jgi:hypothetical protein
MLRIFRHLRQHFSTEGKFSRYLFYAIGEITVGYQIDDICRNAVFRNAVVEIIDARGDWLFGLGLIRSAMQEALETMIPTPELQ